MKYILFLGLLFYSSSLLSQTQILTDIDGDQDDFSGYGLSISDNGNRVAIGSEANDDGGTNAGSVRVYDYNASGWVQVGSDIIGEAAADLFGHAVSLSSDGNRLAIGADRNDRSVGSGSSGVGDNGGHARIYEFSSGSWTQLGANIDGEGPDDRFGHAISLSGSGTRVAIGAERNDRGNGGVDNGGHVRVYEYDGTSWNQLGSDLDGAAAGDFFGYSVALDFDGSHLVVGSVLADGGGTDAGALYVYEYNGTSWSQIGSDIYGEVAGDAFGVGVSIDLDGDRIAAGTNYNDRGTGNASDDGGHARVFLYSGSSWTQIGSDIDGEAAGDEFGSSVALDSDGDHLAVGGRLNDRGNGGTDNGGHARVYKYINNDWRPVGGDMKGEAAADEFGWTVDIDADGDRVAIGAPKNDTPDNSGHVRVYDPYFSSVPTIAITASEGVDGFSSKDATLSLRFVTSEHTFTFIEADISVSNGSLSNFRNVNDNGVNDVVYTATLTPNSAGPVTIDVAANTFYSFSNSSGPYNTAADQFNWNYDPVPPNIIFSPLNGSIGVALNTNITLTFDEPIRHVDNNEITDSSVDALLRLKTPIHSGTDIPFEATIDADKKVITINPTSDLAYTQTVWVGIGESVEDSLNNVIRSAAASFTATDTNRTPVLYTYSNQTTFEDVTVTLILMATDLDNDIVSFSVTSSESNVTPLITDSLLTLTPALNWHGQSTITVTATDNNETPSSQVKTFTLTVRPVNDAPSGVTFSPDSIRENLFPGTFVGTILATDIDTGETFIYDMVSGNGVNDRDNDKLLIVNDSLLSNAIFDYEEEDTLFIRLLVRDSGGLTSELSTEVYVIDTPDPILAFSATTLSYGKVIITQSSAKTLTLSSTGTDTVIIDSISQVGGGYSMSAQTYPVKIAPNLTKDFTFTFAPVDTGNSVDQAIFYPRYITGLNRVILDGRAVHDTLPPMIATVTAIKASEAQDILITVPVVDDNLITKVTLNHLVGGNATLYSQEATSNGDGTYSATIGKDDASILGLAYYHTAEDEYANIGISDTSAIEVKYVAGKLDSKVAGTAYPNGFPKDKWRLISVPTNLDFKTVNETLGDELGEEGKYSWKLYEDLGNANWQETQDIKLGNGYWLNQRTEDNLTFGVSSGKSVDITSYLIPIPKGWSLIGNPYPFPVKVDFNNSEVFGPLTYGSSDLLGDEYDGWDAETNTLLPWEGYAVYNRTSDSLDLVINPLAEDAVSSSAVTDGWQINLGVDNGKFSDHYNIIGRRSDASDKLDQWDNPEPPKLAEYLSLSMDRKEWGVESPLTSDIQSMDESNGQWEMYLDTKGIKGTVYLAASIKGDFPLESSAVLFDPIERKSYDLLMDQSIMITRVNDHYDYPLTVLVGSPDYVLAKTEELIAQLPESFTLGQNYPNPFNPETNIPFTIAAPAYVQIAIFNLMGQRVATLESRWFDMGQYSVRWNGKDAQGNQLSTGVYIYSLESAQFRQAKKLILLK